MPNSKLHSDGGHFNQEVVPDVDLLRGYPSYVWLGWLGLRLRLGVEDDIYVQLPLHTDMLVGLSGGVICNLATYAAFLAAFPK